MMQGTAENPVYGFPYVVVRLDTARYAVTVIEHCRTLRDAQDAVDDMTVKQSPVIHVIVMASDLASFLRDQRKEMAHIMGSEMALW